MHRSPTRQPRAWPALALGLGLMLPALAPASEIGVNLQLVFNAQASFADGIDRSLAFDPDAAAARLLGDRLGRFSAGSMAFQLFGRHSVSIADPGVAVLPDALRPLLQVEAGSTATGGLLAEPVVQDLGATWSCNLTALRCSANTVTSSLQVATPALLAPATAAALAQPIRLQASATATPLFDGVVMNSSTLLLSGSMRVDASFSAKTPVQYMTDALAATATGGAGASPARWAAAADDVQALRSARWTDSAVDRSLQAAHTPELETAQRLLAAARDSAVLLADGATPGGSFNTRMRASQQLWDVVATAEPTLSRSRAGSTSEDLFGTDRAAEVAVLRLVLGGADDSSFVAGMADALAHPRLTGPAAAITLDGARLGLDGATLSVFYLGAPDGQVQIDLPGAERHALWRTGFDRAALLSGPADGLTVLGSGSFAGEHLALGGGDVYVGETFSGLLELSGGNAAARLQLNNFYGDDILVVASWGVTAVPEPATALLLACGLALLALGRRRR